MIFVVPDTVSERKVLIKVYKIAESLCSTLNQRTYVILGFGKLDITQQIYRTHKI